MVAGVETFGTFEGEPVGRVVLDNRKGLQAAILGWGGVLQSLTIDVDGRPSEANGTTNLIVVTTTGSRWSRFVPFRLAIRDAVRPPPGA